MKKRWTGLLCAVMAAALGLTGCSGLTGTSDESESVAQEEETTEPEVGETTYVDNSSEDTSEADRVKTEEEPVDDDDVVSIVTDDSLEDISDTTDIRGGTNMNDAVLLPLDTRLLGTIHNGEAMWFAFTTTSDENATYALTGVNKTWDTARLNFDVYDEAGESKQFLGVQASGNFYTLTLNDLTPNATYYLRVGEDNTYTIDFMLIIRETSRQMTSYETADSYSAARGASYAEDGEIYATQNVDDAVYLPLNTKVTGKIHDGMNFYFAFSTSSAENADYSVTGVNMSEGAASLAINIYDEFGKNLQYVFARDDGKAATMTQRLDPNTTYYIAMDANGTEDTINYTLEINGPDDEANALVFETPFELNETQVMFVAESDEFIDRDAAIEALEPVADALLAHPDRSVLIAGTTATDGDQADRVTLSNRRADAVKNLLVNEFNVPASQIETVGLGYEKDPFERGQDREVAGDTGSKFIESEGRKNRRVVILDIDDPIAQEILASN